MPADFFSMNPFSMMRRMQDEMDRVFSSAFGGGRGGQQNMRAWSPAIEVSERDGNYVVCAELPGLRPEDVNVELADDALVIEGERRQEHEENQGGVHRTERSYGHFYRAVPLPDGVSGEQAQANFKDGVLEVKIPMNEQQQQRRRIPIQGGGSQEAGSQPGGGSAQNMGSPGGPGTSGGGANTAGASQPGSGQGNQQLREGKLPGGKQ
jgi:HSP20 family protein